MLFLGCDSIWYNLILSNKYKEEVWGKSRKYSLLTKKYAKTAYFLVRRYYVIPLS